MFSTHKDMAKAIKEESKHCDPKCTGGNSCRVEKIVRAEFSIREAQRNHKNDVNEKLDNFRQKTSK